MCLCADLVTTNNKCVLHSLKYMCFNGLRHFVLLASHVIKCVDYKVVAIDLILMFGRVVCVYVSIVVRTSVCECVFNLMSITYKQDILQTACSNENVKISHIYRLWLPLSLFVVVVAAYKSIRCILPFALCSRCIRSARCNPIHYFIVAV